MDNNISTILIVEDNPFSIYLMRRYVETCGCRAVNTTKSEDILELACQEKPAAIVLESKLPGTNDDDLLQSLKKNPFTRHIPVILCDGWDEKESLLLENVVAYLKKPILYQDFVTTLINIGVV